jgi:hypothetical protein
MLVGTLYRLDRGVKATFVPSVRRIHVAFADWQAHCFPSLPQAPAPQIICDRVLRVLLPLMEQATRAALYHQFDRLVTSNVNLHRKLQGTHHEFCSTITVHHPLPPLLGILFWFTHENPTCIFSLTELQYCAFTKPTTRHAEDGYSSTSSPSFTRCLTPTRTYPRMIVRS